MNFYQKSLEISGCRVLNKTGFWIYINLLFIRYDGEFRKCSWRNEPVFIGYLPGNNSVWFGGGTMVARQHFTAVSSHSFNIKLCGSWEVLLACTPILLPSARLQPYSESSAPMHKSVLQSAIVALCHFCIGVKIDKCVCTHFGDDILLFFIYVNM